MVGAVPRHLVLSLAHQHRPPPRSGRYLLHWLENRLSFFGSPGYAGKVDPPPPRVASCLYVLMAVGVGWCVCALGSSVESASVIHTTQRPSLWRGAPAADRRPCPLSCEWRSGWPPSGLGFAGTASADRRGGRLEVTVWGGGTRAPGGWGMTWPFPLRHAARGRTVRREQRVPRSNRPSTGLGIVPWGCWQPLKRAVAATTVGAVSERRRHRPPKQHLHCGAHTFVHSSGSSGQQRHIQQQHRR